MSRSAGVSTIMTYAPHSAHGGLTPEAVRLKPMADRLRNLIRFTGRPPPLALEVNYRTSGRSQ